MLEENAARLSILYLNQQRLLTETAEYFSANTIKLTLLASASSPVMSSLPSVRI